jgi:hypothetical protein
MRALELDLVHHSSAEMNTISEQQGRPPVAELRRHRDQRQPQPSG